MSPLNEADTRAKLIDPKIKAAGWGESQIEREHYFVKGRAISKAPKSMCPKKLSCVMYV
jgi:type I restriction enzyme, R subunit